MTLIFALSVIGCALTDPDQDPARTPPIDSDTGDVPELPCSDPGLFVGEGNDTLHVTDMGERLCVLNVTTVEELAGLFRIDVSPGTYAWPGTDGASEYRLPMCIEGAEGWAGDLPEGEISRSASDRHQQTVYQQPLELGGVAMWTELEVIQEGEDPPDPVLNGEMIHTGADGSRTEQTVTICRENSGCTQLLPCKTPQAVTAPEVLSVTRGQVGLYIEVTQPGGVWIDTPRVLYRAEGVLDGVAFEQTSCTGIIHHISVKSRLALAIKWGMITNI